MATLEDKILGEKTHCYCSSGSEHEESDESDDDSEKKPSRTSAPAVQQSYGRWEGVSTNTGPKGVIKDWERFKQLETEKLEDQNKERLRLLKSLTLESEADRIDQDDLELLVGEELLEEYRRRRMQEMLARQGPPCYGKLIDLTSSKEFLDAVDCEPPSVTVLVHIYERNAPSCTTMNSCLASLAPHYPHVKFCKFIGSAGGMSHRFKMDGVPALLVYKGGQVIGNFVRVTDQLGEDFYQGDVENFLIEHGMINDRSCVPPIVGQ